MISDLTTKKITGGLSITNMDDLARIGGMMAKCGYFKDAGDAAKCAVKILAGLELGIPAFSAMTGIHIIQGKPALSANLQAAMIKKSGKYNFKVKELTNTLCNLEFFENGESQGFSSFDMEDAKDAGLVNGANSHNWKKFARNMLMSRAVSNGIKWYCADLFLGAPVYTPEELGVAVNEEGEPEPIKLNHQEVIAEPIEQEDFKDDAVKTLTTRSESGSLLVTTIDTETGEVQEQKEEPEELDEMGLVADKRNELIQEFQDLLWLSSSPEKTWLAIKEKYRVNEPQELDSNVLILWIAKMKAKLPHGDV